MAEKTEFAWVIEHGDSPPSRPIYWAGYGWNYDHSAAIRFSRHMDAVRVATCLPVVMTHHRSCEHGWEAETQTGGDNG